jgi:hypothetical protein
MIRLLSHPLPPSSPVRKMDWPHTGRLIERGTSCWRERGKKGLDEEPNHRTKRNPGPLYFDKILASTKSQRQKFIQVDKILAFDNILISSTKYWLWQNIGIKKILASSTKYLHWQNIGFDKILALTKYRRWQNIGVDKILALTKYWRWQNIGIDKIYTLTKIKYWHQQYIVVDKILAPTKGRHVKKKSLGCYSLLLLNLAESSRSAGKSDNQVTKPTKPLE